jgi:predicted phage-related endonuclease
MSDIIAASHEQAIGCSQLGQLMGVSSFGSHLDLWEQYTGRAARDDIDGELRVALGTPMESVLQPFVEQRIGGKLRRDRKEHRHHTLPLVGHVDFRVATDARLVVETLNRPAYVRPVLDMKTSLGWGAKYRFGEDGTDAVDDSVLLQMHGYMLLTGATLAIVAALVPGPEIKTYTILADSEMQHLIEESIDKFWWYVQQDLPPPPHSEADARRTYQAATAGRYIEADAEMHQALLDLASIKSHIREAEKKEQAIRDRLIPMLADYEQVTLGGKPLATFRNNKASERTAWQEVAREYAMYLDDADAERIRKDHTIVTPGPRVLRLAKSLEAS